MSSMQASLGLVSIQAETIAGKIGVVVARRAKRQRKDPERLAGTSEDNQVVFVFRSNYSSRRLWMVPKLFRECR